MTGLDTMLTDLKPLFKTKMTKEHLKQALLKIDQNVFSAQISEYLKSGVNLPFHDMILPDTNNQIVTNEHFLQIGIDLFLKQIEERI